MCTMHTCVHGHEHPYNLGFVSVRTIKGRSSSWIRMLNVTMKSADSFELTLFFSLGQREKKWLADSLNRMLVRWVDAGGCGGGRASA